MWGGEGGEGSADYKDHAGGNRKSALRLRLINQVCRFVLMVSDVEIRYKA